MKKFQFGLETVLSYKQQVLDALQGEQAVLLGRVAQQEQHLRDLQSAYEQAGADYRDHCAQGLEIRELLAWQAELRARERELESETRTLIQLQREAEEKRKEVVAAKQDTSSIEKLREKQLTSYHRQEAKSQEQLIEEFVSSRRVSRGA